MILRTLRKSKIQSNTNTLSEEELACIDRLGVALTGAKPILDNYSRFRDSIPKMCDKDYELADDMFEHLTAMSSASIGLVNMLMEYGTETSS